MHVPWTPWGFPILRACQTANCTLISWGDRQPPPDTARAGMRTNGDPVSPRAWQRPSRLILRRAGRDGQSRRLIRPRRASDMSCPDARGAVRLSLLADDHFRLIWAPLAVRVQRARARWRRNWSRRRRWRQHKRDRERWHRSRPVCSRAEAQRLWPRRSTSHSDAPSAVEIRTPRRHARAETPTGGAGPWGGGGGD